MWKKINYDYMIMIMITNIQGVTYCQVAITFKFCTSQVTIKFEYPKSPTGTH